MKVWRRAATGPQPRRRIWRDSSSLTAWFPIDGRIKELADENTRGKEGTVERAHALYDYVFRTVCYNNTRN